MGIQINSNKIDNNVNTYNNSSDAQRLNLDTGVRDLQKEINFNNIKTEEDRFNAIGKVLNFLTSKREITDAEKMFGFAMIENIVGVNPEKFSAVGDRRLNALTLTSQDFIGSLPDSLSKQTLNAAFGANSYVNPGSDYHIARGFDLGSINREVINSYNNANFLDLNLVNLKRNLVAQNWQNLSSEDRTKNLLELMYQSNASIGNKGNIDLSKLDFQKLAKEFNSVDLSNAKSLSAANKSSNWLETQLKEWGILDKKSAVDLESLQKAGAGLYKAGQNWEKLNSAQKLAAVTSIVNNTVKGFDLDKSLNAKVQAIGKSIDIDNLTFENTLKGLASIGVPAQQLYGLSKNWSALETPQQVLGVIGSIKGIGDALGSFGGERLQGPPTADGVYPRLNQNELSELGDKINAYASPLLDVADFANNVFIASEKWDQLSDEQRAVVIAGGIKGLGNSLSGLGGGRFGEVGDSLAELGGSINTNFGSALGAIGGAYEIYNLVDDWGKLNDAQRISGVAGAISFADEVGTLAINGLGLQTAATTASSTAAASSAATQGALGAVGSAASIVGAAYSAYNLIDNFGHMDEKTGAINGASTGAAIGTMVANGVGTVVGAVIGAVVGVGLSLFKNGKHEDQVKRDQLRSGLEQVGLATQINGSHHVQLADGSFYDIGLDGGHRIDKQFLNPERLGDNPFVDERYVTEGLRPYDIDYTSDLDMSVAIAGTSLARLIYGGDEDGSRQVDKIGGYFTNAATSLNPSREFSQENFAISMTNMAKFYQDLGLNSPEVIAQRAGELAQNGKITEHEYNQILQSADMMFGGGFNTALKLMEGR